MPGFRSFHLTRFLRGVWLQGLPDADAMTIETPRVMTNLRTDVVQGTWTTRPGWRNRTLEPVASGRIVYLSKLYGAEEDWFFVQIGDTVYQLFRTAPNAATWGSAVAINVVGTDIVSDANYVDGKGGIWKFLVNDTVAIRHNGTDVRTIGIEAPKNAPASATLATDLFKIIDDTSTPGAWTTEGLTAAGLTTDTVIKQSGTQSFRLEIAKGGLGAITRPLTLDLENVAGSLGDETVAIDDYIHIWVRMNRPEWLDYMQIDFDLDGVTFAENYYSVRLPTLARFNQGRDVWTRIQVRKSEFSRFGDAPAGWEHVRGVRLSFLVVADSTMPEAVEGETEPILLVHLDVFILRGGFGIEGDITYTVTYGALDTGARGNPPLLNGNVRYTKSLKVDRHSVVLNLANVAEGGAAHPGQSQIDRMHIWRRGQVFASPMLIATIPDTQTSFTDTISDASLVGVADIFEVDNHLPPTGTTRVLFGPDASGYLFMLVDGHKLYFSKPFEADRFRADNWPEEQYMLIGDGSLKAVGGICTDTETFVGTESQTYRIVGQGADTFVPEAIPNSHEWVGRWAVTAGAGSVFFVANDGIYEMRGGDQRKLTEAIDPFFHGTRISGIPGLSRSPAVRAQIHLQYYPDPQSDTLLMTYSNRFLVVKRHPDTGTFTECFFGLSRKSALYSLFVDTEANTFFAGGAGGTLYQIEDVTIGNDAGTAIPFVGRTKSMNFTGPHLFKKLQSVTVEGNTSNQPCQVTAFYDRESRSEVLGTLQTNSPVGVGFFQADDSEARLQSLAIQVSGEVIRRVTIARLSCAVAFVPELFTILDSDVVILNNIHHLKYLEFDLLHTQTITVTVSIDGVLKDRRRLLLPPISPTQRVTRHYVPHGLKGYIFRVTLQSAQPIELYNSRIFLKPIGNDLTSGFKAMPLVFPSMTQEESAV